MKKLRTILVPTEVRNAETGELIERKTTNFTIMPVDTRDGRCAECAVKHEPEEPHNAQSMAYQYQFYAQHRRWPTWADAVAHCSPEMKTAWKTELENRGEWSE